MSDETKDVTVRKLVEAIRSAPREHPFDCRAEIKHDGGGRIATGFDDTFLEWDTIDELHSKLRTLQREVAKKLEVDAEKRVVETAKVIYTCADLKGWHEFRKAVEALLLIPPETP